MRQTEANQRKIAALLGDGLAYGIAIGQLAAARFQVGGNAVIQLFDFGNRGGDADTNPRSLEAGDYQIAAAICFESTFPSQRL